MNFDVTSYNQMTQDSLELQKLSLDYGNVWVENWWLEPILERWELYVI